MRNPRRFLKVLGLLIFSIVLLSFIPTVSANQPTEPEDQMGLGQTEDLYWELAIDLSVKNTSFTETDLENIRGVFINTDVSSRIEDNHLLISGHGDTNQLQSVLFDASPEKVNYLGGPVELEICMPSNGSPLVLSLEGRTSSGYRWEIVEDSDFQPDIEPTEFSRYDIPGSSGLQIFTLSAEESAEANAKFVYRRPFEPDEQVRSRLLINFSERKNSVDIIDPTPLIYDEIISQDIPEDEFIDEIDSLPVKLDWRKQGIVPPIRNQGSCGSCWAFATVGVMETAMAKAGTGIKNLSEQFLVDCAYTSYGCDGGYIESKFHYDRLGTNQNKIGAVTEADRPYLGYDSYCYTIPNHPYRLKNWDWLSSPWYAKATTLQLKAALNKYGPITTSVCAGPVFQRYSGGVYSTEESYYCDGYTNHAVMLVGYDDSIRAFILRNSWGTNWGNNGYMYIRYGVSNVGSRASWATFTSPPPAPKTVKPALSTDTHTPQYVWTAVPNATSYEYEVYAGKYKMFSSIQSSSVCGDKYCYHRPPRSLPDRGYTWRVRANRNGVLSPWSSYKWFNVATNFYSGFKSDTRGWNTVFGPWSLFSSNFYRSTGWLNYNNSIVHDGLYPTFAYTVRMMRVNDLNTPNSVIVRGTPYPLLSNKQWKNGYIFQYTNGGLFRVQKCVNGTCTILKSWTRTGAINSGTWNLIKVVGNGTRLEYHINNKLIWIGNDSALSTGKVGIGFLKDNSPVWQPLLIDVATLTTTIPTSSAETEIWAEIGESYPEWDNLDSVPPVP